MEKKNSTYLPYESAQEADAGWLQAVSRVLSHDVHRLDVAITQLLHLLGHTCQQSRDSSNLCYLCYTVFFIFFIFFFLRKEDVTTCFLKILNEK